MIDYIAKLLRRRKYYDGKVHEKETQDPVNEKDIALSTDLHHNLKAVKKVIGVSSDIVIREFVIGRSRKRKAILLFTDGMCNVQVIQDHIIKPLMLLAEAAAGLDEIRQTALTAGEVKQLEGLYGVVNAGLTGDAVLLVDGFSCALSINAKGWKSRAISETETEPTVRGPRESFNENLRTNTVLLRRRIQNPDLKIETIELGVRTRTKICIAYVDSIVNPELVKEVKRRLKNISTDAVLSDGYIEEYIEDAPYSVFQTVAFTEKPDVVAGKLLEGRLAILVDGSPFTLTVPMLFIENFQTAEDYSQRRYFASFLRILRLGAFFVSLLAPALYVAFTTFHQELIPTRLLFTMAAASEGVPFPAALEAAVMLITFEVLREAGVRLPRPVGQAVSIVGALVMGQAAVQAGLVGAPVVIIIAFTAVSGFVLPYLNEAVSILRWFLLILATFMGGVGITLGILGIFVHLATLKSFSADYLSPIAPFQPEELKDSFVRTPLWNMKMRPRSLKPQDLTRQNLKRPYYSRYKKNEGGGKGERK